MLFLSLAFLPRTSKLHKKLSAFKNEHPALHNIKFLSFFSLFVVIFILLGQDPHSQLRIRIQRIKINADPDPHLWSRPDPTDLPGTLMLSSFRREGPEAAQDAIQLWQGGGGGGGGPRPHPPRRKLLHHWLDETSSRIFPLRHKSPLIFFFVA